MCCCKNHIFILWRIFNITLWTSPWLLYVHLVHFYVIADGAFPRQNPCQIFQEGGQYHTEPFCIMVKCTRWCGNGYRGNSLPHCEHHSSCFGLLCRQVMVILFKGNKPIYDALFTAPVQAWWHRYQCCGTGAKLDIEGKKLALAITMTPVPYRWHQCHSSKNLHRWVCCT